MRSAALARDTSTVLYEGEPPHLLRFRNARLAAGLVPLDELNPTLKELREVEA
jgi:hypothetical protein